MPCRGLLELRPGSIQAEPSKRRPDLRSATSLRSDLPRQKEAPHGTLAATVCTTEGDDVWPPAVALSWVPSRARLRSAASRLRVGCVEWALAVVALALIAFGVVSRRVDGTPITPAIIFVGLGLLSGAQALDLLDTPPTGESVKLLAEATLAVVLFADASRINLRTLRREYAVPARLLGIGLPLTIALGAVLAGALFSALSIPEALVLAVLLAPTDAALGQAVVTEPKLPSRIRQGLNVESGLNDGICVPLLFIVLAIAEADAGEMNAAHAVRLVVEEIVRGLWSAIRPRLRSPTARSGRCHVLLPVQVASLGEKTCKRGWSWVT